MQNIKRNRFNKLLHISYSLNTQSLSQLQRAIHSYTSLLNNPIYTFNTYKNNPLSLELHADIIRLKTLTSKYTKSYWLKKYKLTKNQTQELNYFINWYLQGSKMGLQVHKTSNTTQISPKQNQARNRSNQALSKIYTIGYEGKSIDELIQILHRNNIKTLVDIRNNPFSYKYLYSKDELKKVLPKFNIKYIHYQTLGIEGNIRNSENIDTETMWNLYKSKLNNHKLTELSELKTLIQEDTVCLMCFESNHTQCHRHILSKDLQTSLQKEIIHL